MKVSFERISAEVYCLAIATAILVGQCGTVQAQLNTPPAGFTPLFNGKDLSGWYGWSTQDPSDLWTKSAEEQAKYKKESVEGGLLDKNGKPNNEHINAHWSVQNGELVNDGHGHYLSSDKDYADFELHLEYKALPKGDSGVYLRGTPQVQIWDPAEPDPSGLGRALGSGGLWNNRKGSPGKDPLKKMDKPLGEWNSLKMTMIGEQVTVVFNGEEVIHADLNNWPEAKKNPDGTPNKFPVALKDYARSGPIGLQGLHGAAQAPVWYRHLKIKVLD